MNAKTVSPTLDVQAATAERTRPAARIAALAAAAVLGASLVFLVGFAHSQVLHDAAHDTRHSNGFPCH